MQGLQIGDFGRFVFTNEYNDPFDIEGVEIRDMDQHWVWLVGKDSDIYNVKKANIKLFEPMRMR